MHSLKLNVYVKRCFLQLKRQNEELKLLDYDSNERIRKEMEREYSNIDSVKNEKNGRYCNNLRTHD